MKSNFKLYLLTQEKSINNNYIYKKSLITDYSSKQEDNQEIIKNINNIQESINKDTENIINEEINTLKKQLSDNQILYNNYSYNESISIHQNGQKELNFSMSKKIIKNNYIEDNIFIDILKNGSLLLLIDQYENNFLFRVKDINIDFKFMNQEYKYTCQDNFSYILDKQKRGYYIENNIESEDFIGSKNLDFWANKITEECSIEYKYIETKDKIRLEDLNSINNNILTEEIEKIQNNFNRIGKSYIIKEKNEDSLNDLFLFSISSSTSKEALISLADKIDYNIKTFEYLSEDGILILLYWMEPKKNTKRIQNINKEKINKLSLNFSNNNFNTLLYVTNNEINDEQISMIPSIPPFFLRYFNRSQDWNEWMNTMEAIVINEESDDEKIAKSREKFIDLSKILDGLKIYPSLLYITEKDNFIRVDNNLNIIKDVDWKIDINNDCITKFYFYVKKELNKDNIYRKINCKINFYSKDNSLIQENNFIIDIKNETFSFQDEEYYLFEYEPEPQNIVENISNDIKYIESEIIFKDIYNQNDIDFAKISKEVPWLENCLIDFSFFVNNNLLSKEKYREIMDKFYYDLRYINIKILLYVNSYTQYLKEKIQKESFLINSIDNLHAKYSSWIESDNEDEKNIFLQDLEKFFIPGNFKQEEIFDFKTILIKYINLYFSSQQRFLKNLKNFCSYALQERWIEDKDTYNTNIDWYYSDNIDEVIKIEINSQLTEYWQVAYNASKNCEFYIPENWEDFWLLLNKNYELLTQLNDSISWEHKPAIYFSIDENMTNDINNIFSDIDYFNNLTNLLLSLYNLNNLNNTIYFPIIKVKENTDNYIEQKDYYFLSLNTDFHRLLTKDKRFLKDHNDKQLLFTQLSLLPSLSWNTEILKINENYNFFSGFYSSMILKLLIFYKDYNENAYEYEKFKNKQKEFWNNMFKDYPYLFLSTTYGDSNTASSIELLNSAKNAFQDLIYPEIQYNINFLNENNNIIQQEIKIGDLLQIDIENFDFIYKNNFYSFLSNLLFVTDIKYSLRKNDFNFTINSIKHRDKILHKLTKLIK